MPLDSIGKVLVIFGGCTLFLGLVLILLGRVPLLGRLPGDLHLRLGSVEIFIPLMTCLLLSCLLTLVLSILARLWRG